MEQLEEEEEAARADQENKPVKIEQEQLVAQDHQHDGKETTKSSSMTLSIFFHNKKDDDELTDREKCADQSSCNTNDI